MVTLWPPKTPGPWEQQIASTIHTLQGSNLLRVQRPTIPVLSSTEALIGTSDLQAWAAGQPSGSNILATASWQRHLSHPLDSPAVTPWSQHLAIDQPSMPAQDTNNSDHSHQPSDAEPGQGSGSRQWQASSQQGPGTATRPRGASELQAIKLFSLNDYLGLASHPDVCDAAAYAAEQYGMGSRSSAIVGGTSVLHRQLEEELAQLKGTEDCLLFPTGFAANMAVVSSLASLGGPVAILSDELNHASIIDGARLAVRGNNGQVTLCVYRHNDMVHLEELLRKLPHGTRAMVVTDSLFSMDGDFADLKALARLRARYGFLLAVDEAHATLVVGERGAGAAEAMGVAEQVDVHVGTLSKAFGALGGFVATTRAIKELLVNKGRAYVYSTALPLPVVAAAQAALMVSKRESWRRAHVWSLVERLGTGLGVPAISPVVPLVVGSEQEALRLGSLMLQHNMHVPAIRPPTVPPGTCRLRVSLSAAHSAADVDKLIHVMLKSRATLQALPHLVQQQEQQRREGWCWPYGWPIETVEHVPHVIPSRL